MTLRVYLMRHGETAWSLSGQHTGRTDIPLTENGRAEARELGKRIRSIAFAQVFCSPLIRALQTCELAGLPLAIIWHYEPIRQSGSRTTSANPWRMANCRLTAGFVDTRRLV